MRFETEERGKRRIYRIRKAVTTAGRDLSCDISLASVSVSRRHVEFVQEGKGLRFKDLGSRNGVRLNGQAVRDGALSDGDRLQIGDVPLVFYAGEAQGAPVADEAEARAPTGEEQAPTPLDLNAPAAPPAPEAAPAPVPSAPARTSGPLRSRKVLIAAGVGVLAVAAALVARPLLKPKPPPPPSYDLQDYAEEVRGALDAFRRYEAGRLEGAPSCAASLAEARKLLGHARAMMPDRELASKLDRALAFQERLGRDYTTFPHDDAWKAWADVKEVRGIEPDLITLATQRQKWMDDENEALRVFEKEAKGKAAEGKRDEALAILSRIPAGSLSRAGADDMADRLRSEGLEEWRSRSEAAASRGDWDQALSALDRAGAYAATEEGKAELDGLRRAHEGRRDEEALYARAVQAFKAGEMDEAKALLASFQPESRFIDSVKGMLEEIRRQEALSGLRRLFAQGEGSKALVEMGSLPEGVADPAALASLKDLIERVSAASERAVREEQAGRLLEAAQAWRETASLLRDSNHKGNAYRTRAEAFLGKWTAEAIAEHYLQAGNQRAGKGDFIGARESYELARKADPKGEMGEEEVRKIIIPQAKHLQTDAFGYKAKGNLELARKTLEEALAMLRPGDPSYEGIRKDLAAVAP